MYICVGIRYLVLLIFIYDLSIYFELILLWFIGINCNYLLYWLIVGKKVDIFFYNGNYFFLKNIKNEKNYDVFLLYFLNVNYLFFII